MNKFKYERKNEKDSGRNNKITPSCKWIILYGNVYLASFGQLKLLKLLFRLIQFIPTPPNQQRIYT